MLRDAFKHRSMDARIEKARIEWEEREGREVGENGNGAEEDGGNLSEESEWDADPPRTWENQKKELMSLATTGPDGKGDDPNIKSAVDLKEAMLTICRSWTSIRKINWATRCLPFFSEMVDHLERIATLEEIIDAIESSEEDFYHEGPPPVGTLHPPSEL